MKRPFAFIAGPKGKGPFATKKAALEAVQKIPAAERGQGVIDLSNGKIYDNVGQELHFLTYTEWTMLMAALASVAKAAISENQPKLARLLWTGVAVCGRKIRRAVSTRYALMEVVEKDQEATLSLLQTRLEKALAAKNFDEVARITERMRAVSNR